MKLCLCGEGVCFIALHKQKEKEKYKNQEVELQSIAGLLEISRGKRKGNKGRNNKKGKI